MVVIYTSGVHLCSRYSHYEYREHSILLVGPPCVASGSPFLVSMPSIRPHGLVAAEPFSCGEPPTAFSAHTIPKAQWTERSARRKTCSSNSLTPSTPGGTF